MDDQDKKDNQEKDRIDPEMMDHLTKGAEIGKPRTKNTANGKTK